MSKTMQNVVVFMEPSHHAHETPLKAGIMILNRFSIDEDAAFELSGVNSLNKAPKDMGYPQNKTREGKLKIKEKGKEYLF